MGTIILLWFFLLGTVFGSFYNVVIYRFNTGKSLSGRSHCLSCNEQLKWYELLPLLSYLAQMGACRHCGARITSRYFWVELAAGLMFALVAYLFLFDPVLLLLNLAIGSLLLILVVYDLRHTIIPDPLVLYLTALALAYACWDPLLGTVAFPTLDSLLGGIIPAAFFGGLWIVSRGRWVGLGDAKLAFPLGLIVGLWGSISMLVLSFWIGAAVSVLLLAIQQAFQGLAKRPRRRGQLSLLFFRRQITMKSEVPFAPFLVAAFLLVHLAHVDAFALTDILLSLFTG